MTMRLFSIIGRKGSGKTTLMVALAREFKRQGKRVGTIKHASHPALVDAEGTDSFRHFHQGMAERSMVASPDLRVTFERTSENHDPVALATRYMAGLDLVLCEGFRGSILPRVEVVRREVSQEPPYYTVPAPGAGPWLGVVTDDLALSAPCRIVRFQDTMWLPVISMLAWEHGLLVEP